MRNFHDKCASERIAATNIQRDSREEAEQTSKMNSIPIVLIDASTVPVMITT